MDSESRGLRIGNVLLSREVDSVLAQYKMIDGVPDLRR